MEAEKGPDVPEFDCLVLAVTNQVAPVPSWVQEGNSVNVTWKFLRNSSTQFKGYPVVSIFEDKKQQAEQIVSPLHLQGLQLALGCPPSGLGGPTPAKNIN